MASFYNFRCKGAKIYCEEIRSEDWIDLSGPLPWTKWRNFGLYAELNSLFGRKVIIFSTRPYSIDMFYYRVWSEKIYSFLHRFPSVYPGLVSWPWNRLAQVGWARIYIQYNGNWNAPRIINTVLSTQSNRGQTFKCRGQGNDHQHHLSVDRLTTWCHFFVLVCVKSAR